MAAIPFPSPSSCLQLALFLSCYLASSKLNHLCSKNPLTLQQPAPLQISLLLVISHYSCLVSSLSPKTCSPSSLYLSSQTSLSKHTCQVRKPPHPQKHHLCPRITSLLHSPSNRNVPISEYSSPGVNHSLAPSIPLPDSSIAYQEATSGSQRALHLAKSMTYRK